MPGPDLTDAEASVEALMDDVCRITRNPAGRSDARLDPITLRMDDPTPAALVYEGKCLVSAPASSGSPQSFGRKDTTVNRYFLGLPLSVLRSVRSAEPAVGDLVQILSSRRDPSLADPAKIFEVQGVVYKTFSVSRRCEMQLRVAG